MANVGLGSGRISEKGDEAGSVMFLFAGKVGEIEEGGKEAEEGDGFAGDGGLGAVREYDCAHGR